MAQKKKLSKNRIRVIVLACISAAIAIALIITDFFVPVKYLASYMVLHNKGAAEGVMRVRFVDVGYGNCTIIELPDGKNMLIDGGNGSTANNSRILKFLNKCDIDVIDYLVCTNVNAEHCGGLSEIIRYKKVKKIYFPGLEFKYATEEYKNFCLAANGANVVISQYHEWEEENDFGYFFSVLSPSLYANNGGEYSDLSNNPQSIAARNNASAVIWLEYAGTSFLFTSDVSQTVLQSLCSDYRIEPNYFNFGGHAVKLENCNVLQVPDHGGKSAVYTPFYDLVRPEVAVVSTDRADTTNGVYSDLFGCGCENIYSTDEYGTVTIEVTADGYAVV